MMLLGEKRNHRKYLLIFILLLHWNSTGFSQNPDHKVYLTLQGSISRALQRNNQIKSSYYGLQKAKWDKYRAWTRL